MATEQQKKYMDFTHGGEEFLIICSETNLEGAQQLAEKFRLAIESFDFKSVPPQTTSFGTMEFYRGDSIEKVFNNVDKKLYQAKHDGKNKVC